MLLALVSTSSPTSILAPPTPISNSLVLIPSSILLTPSLSVIIGDTLVLESLEPRGRALVNYSKLRYRELLEDLLALLTSII